MLHGAWMPVITPPTDSDCSSWCPWPSVTGVSQYNLRTCPRMHWHNNPGCELILCVWLCDVHRIAVCEWQCGVCVWLCGVCCVWPCAVCVDVRCVHGSACMSAVRVWQCGVCDMLGWYDQSWERCANFCVCGSRIMILSHAISDLRNLYPVRARACLHTFLGCRPM